jgi:hypothetical protein
MSEFVRRLRKLPTMLAIKVSEDIISNSDLHSVFAGHPVLSRTEIQQHPSNFQKS